MTWNPLQAKIPFDQAELEYIASLDPNADVLFLQQELPWIPEGSLRILQASLSSSDAMLSSRCKDTPFISATIQAMATWWWTMKAVKAHQLCLW